MGLEGKGNVHRPCYLLLSRVLIDSQAPEAKRGSTDAHTVTKPGHIHPEFLFQIDFVPPELSANDPEPSASAGPSAPASTSGENARAEAVTPPSPAASASRKDLLARETVRLRGAADEAHRAFEVHLATLQDAALRSELVECHLGSVAAQKAMAQLRSDLSHETSRTADIAMQVRFLAKSVGRRAPGKA